MSHEWVWTTRGSNPKPLDYEKFSLTIRPLSRRHDYRQINILEMKKEGASVWWYSFYIQGAIDTLLWYLLHYHDLEPSQHLFICIYSVRNTDCTQTWFFLSPCHGFHWLHSLQWQHRQLTMWMLATEVSTLHDCTSSTIILSRHGMSVIKIKKICNKINAGKMWTQWQYNATI